MSDMVNSTYVAEQQWVTLIDGYIPVPGEPGPPGPKGPEGGTPVVSVAYNAWPPSSPVPDTLYLRLAP